MTASLTYSESIFVAASPKEVYAAVSDITRMGEWSPVCTAGWWEEGAGPSVGSAFTGRNEADGRTWETQCEVIAADEGKKFGFSVNKGRVFWVYSMEAVEGGTELTESWELTPAGQDFYVERHGADEAPTHIQARVEAAHSGIHETLSAMKRVIEQS